MSVCRGERERQTVTELVAPAAIIQDSSISMRWRATSRWCPAKNESQQSPESHREKERESVTE